MLCPQCSGQFVTTSETYEYRHGAWVLVPSTTKQFEPKYETRRVS